MNILKRIGRKGQANKATIWTIVALIILVTGGLIIASIYSSGDQSNPNGFVATTAPALTASDWTIGNPNAKVTLVEYGDFECPACGEYHPVVQELIQNYSSTVLFVFRNYPLYTIHPFAGIGAQAAEAAGAVGGVSKYWAMNDMLYNKQQEWSTNASLSSSTLVSQYFNGYAQSIGIDVAKFDAAINSATVLNKIQTDVDGGNSASVDHTPTFFVNLKQIQNPTSLQDFENTLNAAVSAAGGTAPSATTNVPPITVTSTSL